MGNTGEIKKHEGSGVQRCPNIRQSRTRAGPETSPRAHQRYTLGAAMNCWRLQASRPGDEKQRTSYLAGASSGDTTGPRLILRREVITSGLVPPNASVGDQVCQFCDSSKLQFCVVETTVAVVTVR
jgi:hypothetical protein